MRHFRLIGISIVAAIAIAAAAGAQTPAPPVMPAPPASVAPTPTPYATGIALEGILTQQINSATSQVADSFTFQTKTDTKLGEIDIPAGSPGHGRLAVVVPAANNRNGQLSLQADSIDLPSGLTIWVNIDPTLTPVGHFASGRSGNIVLAVGTEFRVVTITPRKTLAPLLTAPSLPPAAAESPVATAVPIPAALPSAPSSAPAPAASPT